MMRHTAALAALLLAVPRPASATWSITAVDEWTREVGIAGASCTPNVMAIAGVVPGRGVIAAQAATDNGARQWAVEMLRAGTSPADIVRAVTDSTFDPAPYLQQYGIAALGHAPAAYTGAQATGWVGHEVDAGVSVQGNVLVGPRVVADAMAAFRAAAADTLLTLADRLLLALEAGAEAGGDARCPGQTALSAFLIVAGPDDRRDAQHLRLYVNGQSQGGANPVQLLRQRYDEWRRLIRSHEAGEVSAGPMQERANAFAATTTRRPPARTAGLSHGCGRLVGTAGLRSARGMNSAQGHGPRFTSSGVLGEVARNRAAGGAAGVRTSSLNPSS
jgi:uncharacterized Ntn-hydrolase superfamily protein